MRVRGFFPDEVTMCTTVKVLKDVGEFDKAHRFYKGWCDESVELDDLDLDLESSFRGNASGRSTNGSASMSISFMQFLSTELFKIGGRVSASSDRAHSNLRNVPQKPRLSTTYNVLIDLYGKARQLSDASEVFEQMLKEGVAMDVWTFNTMIFICGSRGDLVEAEALLGIMEEKGVAPDTKTYNIFLSLYAEARDVDVAASCYRRVREAGLCPDVVTYRALLGMLCKKNMVQDVEDLIDEMERDSVGVDEHSLSGIVEMYVCEGNIDKVYHLLKKFHINREMSLKIRATFMDVFAERGLCEEAENLFYGGRDLTVCKKDVLECNVMIKAYGKAGLYDKLSDAKRVYGKMVRVGVRPNEVMYGSLINGYAEHGSLEETLKYFYKMEESRFSANLIVSTSLLKAYCKVENLEGAKAIYERMKNMEGGLDLVACNSMIGLFADLGLVSEAKLAFENLREMGRVDAVSYATIMYLYKAVGMMDKAIEIVEEMKLSGLLEDCVSYNKVLVCYAANGKFYECVGMHTLALESARTFIESEVELDSFAYNVASYAYGSAGDINKALNIYMKMRDKHAGPDLATYIYLVGCYGKAGMVEGVKRVPEADKKLYEDGYKCHSVQVSTRLCSVVVRLYCLLTVLRRLCCASTIFCLSTMFCGRGLMAIDVELIGCDGLVAELFDGY
ncbi:Pentatricopeptide repeat-containing protein [Vigna angularis]|uniref:Pentatricopeptide repeat-containing protein n=1 Tax=Phaseolus angularis TaxID=3914 RepID=A0A8T0JJL5_PHAAN|nr:Pentatricopeptide repeat-containing protein [Vigna angularis]